LQYVRRDKNVGPLLNFYYALMESSGKYIAFLADDDYIEPEYIEKLVFEMNNPLVVHACSFANVRMPNGEIIRQEKYNYLGSMTDFDLIKNLYDFRVNSKLALLYYGLTKREIIIEIFPEPEFSISSGKKSVSGLEVPYLAKILSKGQIKIVPFLLFNYTGSGVRDGEQSLALNDSANLKNIDYLFILNGQLIRLIKTIFKIKSDRVNKFILIITIIFSFIFNFINKIIRKINK
jgi:glycosyltransferase involved in cell wall biosynthesis